MADPNFKNRTLYHGDNLEFLRGMNSETVHLIATDPPFNKNRDFHATPDSLASGARFKDRWSWDKDVHEEWTDSIQDDWPAVWEVIGTARAAYGDDMGAFLCWLGVRLMEMRRILRQDGSIYLHIDHTAHAYVKCMMDAIFGRKQFRNEIVWSYQGTGQPKNAFKRKHDTILFYAKSAKSFFSEEGSREPISDFSKSKYTRQDEKGRYKDIRHPDGSIHRQYIREYQRMRDVWDIPIINAMAKERVGFPTQKPLALYRRIIAASSKPGDIVLDPFCGCATTPVAAEQLGREWAGMDIWDKAHDTVLNRLAEEGMLTEDKQPLQFWTKRVHYETAPPARTDDNSTAAPSLKLKSPRPVAPWQKLSHKQMVRILAFAQQSSDGVICAGCGRVLEREFMQLDHILPKAEGGENHILNRVLLCGPCNRRKRNYLTLAGLRRENKKKAVGWMKDESLAKLAQAHARSRAEWLRDNFDTKECQDLIRG